MKTKLFVAIGMMIATLALGIVCQAESGLDLPSYPGAKLLSEINIPPGKLLDALTVQFGPWLGLSDMKELNVVSYAIDSDPDAQQVFKFYEKAIADQQWKTLVKSLDRDNSTAILFNEKKGLLIVNIDPVGRMNRQLTFLQISGNLDPSKLMESGRKLPDLLEKMVSSAAPKGGANNLQSASRIPTNQPISIPPSSSLRIKSTRSDIKARMADGNTAEVQTSARTDDPGELLRSDGTLVLSLSPKLDVNELAIPSAVPVEVELTDGSLTLSGSSDEQLDINATGATVTLESFALVSGAHTVTSVGGDVKVEFSAVRGGSLNISSTGGNVTLILPKDASAKVDAFAPSGRIDDQSGFSADKSSGDRLGFQLGSGKARLNVKAVNGTITLRSN